MKSIENFRLKYFLMIVIMMTSWSARSQEYEYTDDAEEEQSLDIADRMYPEGIGEDLSQRVVTLANRLDSFFGEKRADDERNGSTLRISPGWTFYDEKATVFEFGINLNLKFRNLEKKAKKIEDNVKSSITKVGEAVSNSVGPEKSKDKKKVVKKTKPVESWIYNFESQATLKPGIYYSGQLRAHKNFPMTTFVHHVAAQAGWDTDDKWTQKTSLASDYVLAEDLLFRFANDFNWMITKSELITGHGPSVIQTVNDYNSVSYNFRFVTSTKDGTPEHSNTYFNIDWRHSTPLKRVFVDIVPQIAYPRENQYKEERSIQLKFEYVFGDV